MINIKEVLRNITPFGLVDARRRKLVLASHGLDSKSVSPTNLLSSLNACRFSLWPAKLKDSSYEWTLVDVGANRGQFVQSVYDCCQPKNCYAFEPNPMEYSVLTESLSNIRNKTLYPFAVGSDCCDITLNCTSDSKFSSVLHPKKELDKYYKNNPGKVLEKIICKQVTLDSCLQDVEVIGLLKIDVQGYELEVLKGAEVSLRKTFALMLEVNYQNHYKNAVDFDCIHSYLARQNFTVHGISEPFFGDGKPLWADALYVNKDLI